MGQLAFQLPRGADVRIDILDITGRTIQSGLLNGRLPGGEHITDLPGNILPGVYLIRLQVDNQVEVKKWVVH